MFIKEILNNLSKDQLKEIRDYLYKNNVYVWKEARKLITDGLLGIIYKPTPSKWPTDDTTNNPTNNPTDESTDGFTNDPTNNPTNNPTDDLTDDPTPNSTLALLLLLTTPV